MQAFILFTIPRVQHSLKIALSLPVSEILPFFIFRINRRWPPKFEKKLNFFGLQQNTLTTPRVQTSLETALCLTVSEIFMMFYFPQKSKMAAKSCN